MTDSDPLPFHVDAQGIRLVGDRWTPTGHARGTVLLLHGGGQRRHSWRATGHRLARAGWSAIALDARGHGDSDWCRRGDYSVDALVDDLVAVVAALGERPVLVGASMGGMTALVGEGERGDLARALVLVDIAPRVEADGVQRIMDFMSSAPEGFGSLAEVADAVRTYNPHRVRPPSMAGLRRNVRRGPDGRFYWHWDPALLRVRDDAATVEAHERSREAAIRIAVPTLLVRGARSDILSQDGASELLELIPGASQIDVSAGHMVAGDDNDIFTARLGEFLATLENPDISADRTCRR